MKAKVIMLAGPGSCGKTAVLHPAHDRLLDAGSTVIEPKEQLGENPHDFKSITGYGAAPLPL
jgi:hypothetical protein